MLFGKDRTRRAAARRQPLHGPGVERLETRQLLAGAPVLNLGLNTGTTLPAIALASQVSPNYTTGPFGVALAGQTANGGAGFSVTDVGDMNNDGYDDYVVGAPTSTTSGGQLVPGSGLNSRVYLVFGSQQVTAQFIANNVQNWLTQLEAYDKQNSQPQGTSRVGNLNQMGNTTQTNPITNAPQFPFSAITFQTDAKIPTQLGASVARLPQGVAVPGVSGLQPAFLIGAPGADALGDSTGTAYPNYGRVYLVVGGSYLSKLSPPQTVTLDNANNVVTFGATATSGVGPIRLGSSVAALANFFDDGPSQNAVAIGAPMATYNGNANAGVVFVVKQSTYQGQIGVNNPTAIDLSTVGQGNTSGVIFGGAAANDYAGFSVADAGSVDRYIKNQNAPTEDLLIGAPGTLFAGTNPTNPKGGTAYLVYGRATLPSQATTNVGPNNSSLTSIPLNSIGDPSVTSSDILGAVFTGTPGDATGYAVAGAGDVNNDGYADFLIGAPLENSPGFLNSASGRASLVFGQPTSTSVIKGNISLGNLAANAPAGTSTPPITIQVANFLGDSGDLAGYSVSALGNVNLLTDKYPEFLIGAPGYANDQGAAFLVAGRFDLVGPLPLDTRNTIVTTVSPNGVSASGAFFGASVSGKPYSGTGFTADQDFLADPIVGAPGYTVNSTAATPGGAFLMQGAYLQPLVPQQLPNTVITAATSTGSTTTTVNANGPLYFRIVGQQNVKGINGNNFEPVTGKGIDTTTLELSSSLSTISLPIGNGSIPGITVTVSPVQNASNPSVNDFLVTVNFAASMGANPLGLFNGSQKLTLTGLLTTNELTAPATQLIGGFSAAFNANVVNGSNNNNGGGGTGVSGVGSATPIGLIVPTYYQPVFGPDVFVPTPTMLSAYNYKAIPTRVAYMQFQPNLAFKMRILNYVDPAKYHFQAARTASPNKHGSSLVLKNYRYDTSLFHPGKRVTFRHKGPVIPTQEQVQHLNPRHP